jgi:hypothetical protein
MLPVKKCTLISLGIPYHCSATIQFMDLWERNTNYSYA